MLGRSTNHYGHRTAPVWTRLLPLLVLYIIFNIFIGFAVADSSELYFSGILHSASVKGSIWLIEDSSQTPLSPPDDLPALTVDYIVSTNSLTQFLGTTGGATKAQMVTFLTAMTASLSFAYRERFSVKMIGYTFQDDTYDASASQFSLGSTSYFDPSVQTFGSFSASTIGATATWIQNLRESSLSSSNSNFTSHVTFYLTADSALSITLGTTLAASYFNTWVASLPSSSTPLLGTKYAIIPVVPFFASILSLTLPDAYEVTLWNMFRGLSILAAGSSLSLFSAVTGLSGLDLATSVLPSTSSSTSGLFSSNTWTNSNNIIIYNWLTLQTMPTCGFPQDTPSFDPATNSCNEVGLLCNYCQLGLFTTTASLHTTTSSNIVTPWCFSPQCCDVTSDPTLAINKVCLADNNAIGACNIFGSCVKTVLYDDSTDFCTTISSSTNITTAYFTEESASDMPTLSLADSSCAIVDSSCVSSSTAQLNSDISTFVGCSTALSVITSSCVAADASSTTGTCVTTASSYLYQFHDALGNILTANQLSQTCTYDDSTDTWIIPTSVIASCYLSLGTTFLQLVDTTWCVQNSVATLSRSCAITTATVTVASTITITGVAQTIDVDSCYAYADQVTTGGPCGQTWALQNATSVIPVTCSGTIGSYDFAMTSSSSVSLPNICSNYISDVSIQCQDTDTVLSSSLWFYSSCSNSDFSWLCHEVVSSQNVFSTSVVDCSDSTALALAISLPLIEVVAYNSPACVLTSYPTLAIFDSLCSSLTVPTTGVNITQNDYVYSLDTTTAPSLWYDVSDPSQTGTLPTSLLKTDSTCYLRTLAWDLVPVAAYDTTTFTTSTTTWPFYPSDIKTLSQAIAGMTVFSAWQTTVIDPWNVLLAASPFVDVSGCNDPIYYCNVDYIDTLVAESASESQETVSSSTSLDYSTWDGSTFNSITIQPCQDLCPSCSNTKYLFPIQSGLASTASVLYQVYTSSIDTTWVGLIAPIQEAQLTLPNSFILPCQNFSSCEIEPLCWDPTHIPTNASQALCDAISSASTNDPTSSVVPCSNQCGVGHYNFHVKCGYVNASGVVIDTDIVTTTTQCLELKESYFATQFSCQSSVGCADLVEWQCSTSPSLSYSASLCTNSSLEMMCPNPCSSSSKLKIAAGIALPTTLTVSSQCVNKISGSIIDASKCQEYLGSPPATVFNCTEHTTTTTTATTCCSSMYQFGDSCQHTISFTPGSFSVWGNVDLNTTDGSLNTSVTATDTAMYNLTQILENVQDEDSLATIDIYIGQSIALEWEWNGPSYQLISIFAQFDNVGFPYIITQSPALVSSTQFNFTQDIVPPGATSVVFSLSATANTTIASGNFSLINRCDLTNPFAISCQHNGICQAASSTCTCVNGFTGSVCQNTICDDFSCNVDDNSDSDIMCVLTNTQTNTPFAVVTQEGDIDLLTPGASDLPTADLTPSCNCSSGFYGEYCQYSQVCNDGGNITALTSPQCSNHGYIPWVQTDAAQCDSSSACVCETADVSSLSSKLTNTVIPGTWTGDDCSECQIACQNGGVFNSVCGCACLTGFFGDQCQCVNMTLGVDFLAKPDGFASVAVFWSAAFISDLAADIAVDRSLVSYSHVELKNSTSSSSSSSTKIPFTAYFIVQVCGDSIAPTILNASQATASIEHFTTTTTTTTTTATTPIVISAPYRALTRPQTTLQSTTSWSPLSTHRPSLLLSSSSSSTTTTTTTTPTTHFIPLASSTIATSYNAATSSQINDLYNAWGQLPSTPVSGSDDGESNGDTDSSGDTYMGSGTAGNAAGGVSGVQTAQTSTCARDPSSASCSVSNPFAIGGASNSEHTTTVIIVVVVVVVGSLLLIAAVITAMCLCSRYHVLCFKPTNPDDLCAYCQRQSGIRSEKQIGTRNLSNTDVTYHAPATVRSSTRRSCVSCGQPIHLFSTELSSVAHSGASLTVDSNPPVTSSILSTTSSSQQQSTMSGSSGSGERTRGSSLPVQIEDKDSESLHPDWAKMHSPDGKVYYCNTQTLQTSWNPPSDQGTIIPSTSGLFF